jgi:hypothetical protein
MDIVPTQTRMPTKLGDITITIVTGTDDSGASTYSISYLVQVIDQTNTVMRNPQGDLESYLTASVKTQLKAFADSMRALANAKLLGKT